MKIEIDDDPTIADEELEGEEPRLDFDEALEEPRPKKKDPINLTRVRVAEIDPDITKGGPMSKLIELHIVQSFAPSNLNRDDTGAPKDCFFGGARRARISSQCIKRAIRRHFAAAQLLPPDETGRRTRLARDEIANRLAKKKKISPEDAQTAAAAALEAAGLKVEGDGKTQYLIFWGPDELDRFVGFCDKHFNDLAASSLESAEGARGKEKRKSLAKGVSEELKKLARDLLTVPKAADVALFGRMLADIAEKNVDAASQVAHALSTHRVEMEMDYFTAVDDLQRVESEERTGAGMLGTVSYNAATFYRYANVHWQQLLANLQDDADLAKRAVHAFVRAAVEAIPSGKQNTFAAYNPPSFAFAFVRDGGVPISLANAFERPVPADRENGGGFLTPSINAFDNYWGQVAPKFEISGKGFYLLLPADGVKLDNVKKYATEVMTAAELAAKVVEAL